MLRNGVRLLAGGCALVVRARTLGRDMAEIAVGLCARTYTFPRTARRVCLNAFTAQSKLRSVRLNEGLKTLEYRCFMETGIRKLVVPASLRSIGPSAFSGCERLELVDLGAAQDLQLGERAFLECESLRHVRFGGVKGIGSGCFLGSGLEEIVLPSIQTVEDDTFFDCRALRRVSFTGDGPRSIGKNAFMSSGLEEFVAPASLCRVCEGAFSGCKALRRADFSACLQDGGDFIQREAFCFSALESVVLPLALRAIGECAFINCKQLRSVTFAEGSEERP